MSTNFSFGFQDDDTDDVDEIEENLQYDDQHEELNDISFVRPQLHTLHEIISTFPSQLCFNTIFIPSNDGNSIQIPRRDLFDIRAQLMVEDGNLSTDSVSGLSNDDVIPNIYEGGFKTWECSIDLSDYVWSSLDVNDGALSKDYTLIELGAGTALPSVAFTRKWLSQRGQYPKLPTKMQVCLADYNRSVLELATVPNFYLAMHFCDKPITGNEIDTEPATLQTFEEDLSELNIGVTAISGSWTSELADVVSSICCPSSATSHETIVLASETIYSPASIRIFTETLLSILGKALAQGSRAKALVAAKRVYFGVGGGIDEFLRVLGDLGGQGDIIWETQGTGVGRVIVEVTIPSNRYP